MSTRSDEVTRAVNLHDTNPDPDPTRMCPRHPLPRSPIVDRDPFICDCCTGKRVLHLGCAAWPDTAALFDAKELLHQKLGKTCAALAGIDISDEGISLLRSRGTDNLFVGDASRIAATTRELGWTPEFIIAGEILEHVDAPGPLLRECAEQMPDDCTLIITVPNAHSIKGLLHVLLGHEKVHHDHVAYYSHANMMQLLSRCGLECVDARCHRYLSSHPVERALDFALGPLLRMRPYLCRGLIFCCRRTGAVRPAGPGMDEPAEARKLQ